MRTIIVKNNSGSIKQYVGKLFAINEEHEVPKDPAYWESWSQDEELVQAVQSGDILIGDGTDYLDAELGLAYLQAENANAIQNRVLIKDIGSVENAIIDPCGSCEIDIVDHVKSSVLAHDMIPISCYYEASKTNGFVISEIWWVNSQKTAKIREFLYSRDQNNLISEVVMKSYLDGELIETITETYSRTDGFISNISAVRS